MKILFYVKNKKKKIPKSQMNIRNPTGTQNIYMYNHSIYYSRARAHWSFALLTI